MSKPNRVGSNHSGAAADATDGCIKMVATIGNDDAKQGGLISLRFTISLPWDCGACCMVMIFNLLTGFLARKSRGGENA